MVLIISSIVNMIRVSMPQQQCVYIPHSYNIIGLHTEVSGNIKLSILRTEDGFSHKVRGLVVED